MKIKSWLLFLTAALLGSCAQEVLQEETTLNNEPLTLEYRRDRSYNPHLNGKAVAKPFKIRSAGSLSYIFGQGGCNVRIVLSGNGNASHMGNFSIEADLCLDNEPFIITSTGANGDQLFATFRRPPTTDANGLVTQYYMIIGGTGRFENASGQYDLYGVVDPAKGIFDHSGEGTIVY